jgi:3-oxoacyl-[acyl-carrier-protein] synthase II
MATVRAEPWRSIAQAGISPREVRHLNAHATSTPVGDLGEIAAIKSLFERDFAIAVSATKSATGHLLGAAGGLGAIFAILALRDQVALPTLNLSAPDPTGDGIDFVANQARPMAMDYAVSHGFGFGGVNASALFRRWTDEPTGGSARGAHD